MKTPSVNQFKKQLVKRKIYPHILPEQQPAIPSYPNSTLDIQQKIPAKPSDAKRCKIKKKFVSLKKVFFSSSSVSLHNRLFQKRPVSVSDGQQWNVSLPQRLRQTGRNQIRNLRQWFWSLLYKYEE